VKHRPLWTFTLPAIAARAGEKTPYERTRS
jgi:hypothetical protein